AERARAPDAPRRPGAGRAQIHPPRHDRAAARFLEPAGRGISVDPRAFPQSVDRSLALRALLVARLGGRRTLCRGSGISADDFGTRLHAGAAVTQADGGRTKLDCISSIAAATACPSAITSRITESGVG